MPRTSEKDLFGQIIKQHQPRLRSILKKFDTRTFEDRLARLKHLQTIFPKGYSFLSSPETFFVFNEAKMAFINGEFISTILLAQAFIEHKFQCVIDQKGESKIANAGLAAMTKYLAEKKLLHAFLIQKVDKLRKIRNPFVHLQTHYNSDSISSRVAQEQRRPEQIFAKDAEQALALMYQIATTKM
jgi:hypothetical protein